MNADAGEQTFHEDVKRYATELLELARKELVKEGTSKNEMGTILYDAGFEDGKAEALKDMPRWKKADRDIISNTIEFAVPYTHDGGDHADWVEVIVTNAVRKGENYFEISDLEKLPGFNE